MSLPLNTPNLEEFRSDNGFLPTTFLERGVAVPFTTPLLAGSRTRPGERNQLELIVPVGT